MTVETAVDIAGLDPLLPAEADPIAEGGAHLRLIKAILLADAVRQSQMIAANVGLGNVDNTADADKPVSTLQAAADLAAVNAAKAYADTLVIGLLDDRGNYDASVNLFPSTGGSGALGAILKGDVWTISAAGVLGGTSAAIGQTVRALTDAPAQVAANWAISAGGGGASGGGLDALFYQNDQVMTADYTIPVGQNASITGPFTINAGVTLTVSAGSVLKVH